MRPSDQEQRDIDANAQFLGEVREFIRKSPNHEAAFFSMFFDSIHKLAGENWARSLGYFSEDLGITSKEVGELFAAYIDHVKAGGSSR